MSVLPWNFLTAGVFSACDQLGKEMFENLPITGKWQPWRYVCEVGEDNLCQHGGSGTRVIYNHSSSGTDFSYNLCLSPPLHLKICLCICRWRRNAKAQREVGVLSHETFVWNAGGFSMLSCNCRGIQCNSLRWYSGKWLQLLVTWAGLSKGEGLRDMCCPPVLLPTAGVSL